LTNSPLYRPPCRQILSVSFISIVDFACPDLTGMILVTV